MRSRIEGHDPLVRKCEACTHPEFIRFFKDLSRYPGVKRGFPNIGKSGDVKDERRLIKQK